MYIELDNSNNLTMLKNHSIGKHIKHYFNDAAMWKHLNKSGVSNKVMPSK